MVKIIQTKIENEDVEKISLASKVIGLNRSSFFRMAALEKANKILRANKEDNSSNE
jgi:uncharacterized protein (DUF1778 family)